jgi:hypothetical protein
MTFETVALALFVLVIVAAGSFIAHKRVPRKLKLKSFETKWKDLQILCKDKKMWPQVVVNADALLDGALRRRRFKGKTMGERMVSAQRSFTNNDAVWYAHNFSKKILALGTTRLKESDVKAALVGFRQALRDLGALPQSDREKSEK